MSFHPQPPEMRKCWRNLDPALESAPTLKIEVLVDFPSKCLYTFQMEHKMRCDTFY